MKQKQEDWHKDVKIKNIFTNNQAILEVILFLLFRKIYSSEKMHFGD